MVAGIISNPVLAHICLGNFPLVSHMMYHILPMTAT